MKIPVWRSRFLGSRRGQILNLLRRSESTVNELAQQLELTDNAIRTHLFALERDGLVEQHGVIRGIGKPAYLYRLTLEAEGMFPKAYRLVLQHLMGTLRSRFGEAEVEEMLEETGRSLAATYARPQGDLHARAEVAVALLSKLGGLAEVQPHEEGVAIQGYSCPLSALAGDHPQVCQLATVLLEELTGVSVHEMCDYSDRSPRCRFILTEV